MIYIEADKLQDGLYQIQDGQIHKYKAKGGTVRTYEMGEIVRCKDCKNRARCAVCDFLGADGFCSHGERREDGEA